MAYADNLTWRWKVKYVSGRLNHSFILRLPSSGSGPSSTNADTLTSAFTAIANYLPKNFAFLGTEKCQPLSNIFVPSVPVTTPATIAVVGWDNTLGTNIEKMAYEVSCPYKATDGVNASYTDYSIFGLDATLLDQYADNPYRHTIANDAGLITFFSEMANIPLVVRSGWTATPFAYVNINKHSVQESRLRKG